MDVDKGDGLGLDVVEARKAVDELEDVFVDELFLVRVDDACGALLVDDHDGPGNELAIAVAAEHPFSLKELVFVPLEELEPGATIQRRVNDEEEAPKQLACQ